MASMAMYPTGVRNIGGATAFWFALVAAIAGAAGAILLGPKSVVLLVAMIAGPLFVFLPAAMLAQLLVVLALVVVGTMSYFTGFRAVHWIPYLLCALVGIRSLADRVSARIDFGRRQDAPPLPAFISLLVLFFTLVAMSAGFNGLDLPFWLIAAKNYLVCWFLMFLIWRSAPGKDHWMPVWRLVPIVALIQLPVALLQRYLAKGNAAVGTFNWDAVVGTFGGDPDGGGFSGAMTMFLVFALVFVAELHRRRLTPPLWLFGVAGSALAVIALAEVKASLFLLPMAGLFVYGHLARTRPALFLAGAAGVAAIMFGLLYIYYLMYVAKDGVDRGLIDTLMPRFQYIFDTTGINLATGEVGRLPSLILWWQRNSGDLASLLLGHGPMAVRFSSTFGMGDVLRAYTINIGMYSLPVLLWELGVVATVALLLALISAAFTSVKLARHRDIPSQHQAVLRAGAFCLFEIVLFLPYNRDMIDSAAIQCLAALVLGNAAYWSRQMHDKRKVPH